MNQLTSKKTEMDVIKALSHIKTADIRDSLYDEIITLVHTGRVIPMAKLRSAAAVILCLISLEVYVVTQSSVINNSDYSETLVPMTSNFLYND